MGKLLRLLRRLKTNFFRKTQEEKPFVYVALGDSTVEGIGASDPSRSVAGIIFATILMSRKNAEYHNLGVAGARVQEVLVGQLRKAIALQPDLITLSVGANDVRLHTKPKRFAVELEQLLDQLRQETAAEIVISNIPDMSITPRIPKYAKSLSNLVTKRFNAEIEKAAQKHNAIFVDMYTQSHIYATHPEAISGDGFHPSDYGYALWANTIISHISHILFPKKLSLLPN